MKQFSNHERIRSLRCRDVSLSFVRTPLVMGILNVTPDSFSDGGRYIDSERAIERAFELAEDGADILDIGGESTRPGSDPVSEETELDRIGPVLEAIIGKIQIPISVDTQKPFIAEEALRLGCHMINAVCACRDPRMVEVLLRYKAPVVIMHMKGDPKTMQDDPTYSNVVREVTDFLSERAHQLRGKGIAGDSIVVDPGIGFGKRLCDNLALLDNIGKIRSLGYPVLVGGSRKSFLGKLLDADADHRLSGSLAVAARCWSESVEIIRVHDVKETVELLKVLDAMADGSAYSIDS
ncbi:MAG: dihydropteroate synthase [Candidatus Latescibacteria bacterium]|nr:dihydropteroate synthase [Candidatus Latescibacterota bacterium]NIM66410.1 dihydropteroate synthase [Candidatus Latescibacterota bacterium]NIO02889.1 dihydropteroate synthase [Candidatus Latescibacterota bacterium]NIO30024.1 dihydropteroate synthase [Candidatus Latescibacterota bacterium]NIO57639.1 dihydropteroate synthase [Candidatus Latescibacterota bacterium]